MCWKNAIIALYLPEPPTERACVNRPRRSDALRFALIEEVVHASHKIIERDVSGLTFEVPVFEALRNAENFLRINEYPLENLAFKKVGLEEERQINAVVDSKKSG